MKKYIKYIKLIVVLIVAGFLFAFSNQRNAHRKVADIAINFEAGQNLFITADSVDKLLIQNDKAVKGQEKELLDLKKLEDRLDANAMVKDADVYLTLDGNLGANVIQRKPLARVNSTQPFYIDEDGEAMPLSLNYSARVPLVSGIAADDLAEVLPLLHYIKEDAFLEHQIVGIERKGNRHYILIPRVYDFGIKLGEIKNLDEKFRKYKAFYQKALKDESLAKYSQVDLRFKDQVVGTKK